MQLSHRANGTNSGVRSQPNNPQQTAYVERYNRRFRYNWLNQRTYDTIEQEREQAKKWLWTYNNGRLNMAKSGLTPYRNWRWPLK